MTASCSEEKYTSATDSDQAPGPVSNVKVDPRPGGARISYSLPDDESLRYVRAEYNIRTDFARETKASLYNDNLIVDGFPDTVEYEVKLYAVSKGEHASTPVMVKVKPLLPPLKEAYNTLEFERTFGGVTVSFDNSGEASLAVVLLTDSAGILAEVETYYTETEKGTYSLRGFEAEPRVFGAVVRDRWGNLSDTVTAQITPIFEELIPKDKFNAYNLPTDTYEAHVAGRTMDQIWDDRIAPNGGIPIFQTKPGSGMPQWFTFDMGRLALLSRYKLHHRGPGQEWAYQSASVKKWEIWGSVEPPDPSGSWDGWIKLMDCDSYKPSGEGPITNEDAAYATDEGEDFIFPEDIPPVRYLRFKTLETWGYLDYIELQELTFWGQLQ